MPPRLVPRHLAIPAILLLAAGLPIAGCLAPDPGPAGITETVTGEWVRVYFTPPAGDSPGLDEELAAVIDQAETSIDVAAYDLDLERVVEALVQAQRDGVQVRMVVESDNADPEVLDPLRQAGIAIYEDGRDEGLMHDKFVVVDGQWVWTGSWNLTYNGTYRNDNHVLLIASLALAENYTREFEEMLAGQFGPTSPATTPHRRVTITGEGTTRQTVIESYFAPEDDAAAPIVAAIEGAQSRIRFMAFTITSDDITDALLARAQDGVIVQGVVETRNVDQQGSDFDRLQTALHDVLPDGNPYMMHHKAIIVDDETVIVGSYNFTRSAETSNDENVLIIHDPDIAALFVQEFGRVYEQAR